MATLDAEQIWKLGQGLGLPWGMIRRPEEWLEDEHAAARGFFQRLAQPGYEQRLTVAGPPYAFTEHPGAVGRAPRIGEHNREIYGALGYSLSELTALRECGAI
jgi:crotonobetainyl-CoA:carnitine CoA-transferase CaiB-like acyl-CoA transferase